MKWLALLKQFPKYALVLGVIVGSTALFGFWWFFLRVTKAHPPRDTTAEQAAIRERAAKAAARVDYLFLADDDLYDAGTGELLFRNWLHGDHPLRLFFDPQSKKILGQYDRGFASYAFDGTREAAMMGGEPLAFCDNLKKVVFAKGKNVWVAEADWQNLRFFNERQLTTIDSFYEQHFAENVVLLTGKTLVVRNLNNLLRVDLDSGNVKPTRLPLKDLDNRRSPDSRWVAGVLNGQFYCYDVDVDDSKTIPVGRNGIAEMLWLGNDNCIGLAGMGKAVVAYNRPNHAITEVCTLPFSCFKIGEPSPDGRFIFCAGGMDARNGALVDLEKKSAGRVAGGAGIAWVSNDTFAFSREMPDSDLRGTWLQTVGQGERRISPEPYLVSRAGAQLMALPAAGLVIFETRHGLSTMKPDGSELGELVQINPPVRVLRIQEWKSESIASPTRNSPPNSGAAVDVKSIDN